MPICQKIRVRHRQPSHPRQHPIPKLLRRPTRRSPRSQDPRRWIIRGSETFDIIALAFALAEHVGRWTEQARRFFYAVTLSPHTCPRCSGPIRMVHEGLCRCEICGLEMDPTLEFQRCAACGGQRVHRPKAAGRSRGIERAAHVASGRGSEKGGGQGDRHVGSGMSERCFCACICDCTQDWESEYIRGQQ